MSVVYEKTEYICNLYSLGESKRLKNGRWGGCLFNRGGFGLFFGHTDFVRTLSDINRVEHVKPY